MFCSHVDVAWGHELLLLGAPEHQRVWSTPLSYEPPHHSKNGSRDLFPDPTPGGPPPHLDKGEFSYQATHENEQLPLLGRTKEYAELQKSSFSIAPGAYRLCLMFPQPSA